MGIMVMGPYRREALLHRQHQHKHRARERERERERVCLPPPPPTSTAELRGAPGHSTALARQRAERAQRAWHWD